MPTHSAALSTFRLEKGGFVCSCSASSLDDGAWTSTVKFERVEPPDRGAPPGPKAHRVPGVFLDCESALSAAHAYAVRTVQWQRV